MPEVPQLGERGGGWVVIQFLLMPIAIAVGLVGPSWPDGARHALAVAGAVLALGGGVLVVLSARALGSSLTPYPRPGHPATFVERGPYRVVRHPIYLGGILFMCGFSLAFSPWALLVSAALGVTWALKSAVEERFLRARYPEYTSYSERTRFRLVPYVY